MSFVVGVYEVALDVPAFTLKEKRSVVRRITARVRQRFQASVAEVDELDNAGAAVLAVAVVGNEKPFVERRIQAVSDFIESLYLAQTVDERTTLTHY